VTVPWPMRDSVRLAEPTTVVATATVHVAAAMVTVQVAAPGTQSPTPAQVPLHGPRTKSGSAVAVRTTSKPDEKPCEQESPQSIPAGSEVTVAWGLGVTLRMPSGGEVPRAVRRMAPPGVADTVTERISGPGWVGAKATVTLHAPAGSRPLTVVGQSLVT